MASTKYQTLKNRLNLHLCSESSKTGYNQQGTFVVNSGFLRQAFVVINIPSLRIAALFSVAGKGDAL